MGIQINGQTDIVTSTSVGGRVTIPSATFPSVSNINATGVSTFSGGIIVSSGTTAAPSISPSGNNNTGIFFPSTNTTAVSYGGTEALRVTSSGSIGIGTINPTLNSTMEIYGTNDVNLQLHYTGNSRGGLAALSTQRLAIYTTASADNIVFGRSTVDSTAISSSNFTEQVRINNSNGNVTLNNGNLVFSTAGKGIDFSATANSSGTMTSELLADYEEGTWTPTLTFGGGSTGLIYNVRQGNYTKVGNRVHASCVIWLSNKGSSTGNNSVTGLPYVVRQTGGGANFISVAAQYGDRITPYHCFAPNDGTSLTITTRPTGPASTVVSLSNSDWANDTYMALHFSYRTDA